jgi:hypothetical protein
MNREKEISNIVDECFNQDEWYEDKNMFIEKISNKYYNELEKYIYVESVNDFLELKLGGYIRYVNCDEELKWGGILKKKIFNNDKHYMLLMSKNNFLTRVCFEYNYIFYK